MSTMNTIWEWLEGFFSSLSGHMGTTAQMSDWQVSACCYLWEGAMPFAKAFDDSHGKIQSRWTECGGSFWRGVSDTQKVPLMSENMEKYGEYFLYLKLHKLHHLTSLIDCSNCWSADLPTPWPARAQPQGRGWHNCSFSDSFHWNLAMKISPLPFTSLYFFKTFLFFFYASMLPHFKLEFRFTPWREPLPVLRKRRFGIHWMCWKPVPGKALWARFCQDWENSISNSKPSLAILMWKSDEFFAPSPNLHPTIPTTKSISILGVVKGPTTDISYRISIRSI